MRPSLLLLALLMLPAFAWAKSGRVLYLCAHPDDCLLFMSPNLYNDIVEDAEKVVIIYLTSGDAGLPFHKDSPDSYPLVRERASIDATSWMADVEKEPTHTQTVTESITLRGHPLERVRYANTVSYFLRLPDGNMYGDGFEGHGRESLHKLQRGEISGIRPIDGQAAYLRWQDLVEVLSGILSHEMQGERMVTLHIADPDTKNNIHDHSDHTTGAAAMMDALKNMADSSPETAPCHLIYKHIDYSIAERIQNLDGVGLQNKSAGFAVLTATQRHFLESHNWDKAHLSYLTRNYYTLDTVPEGCDTMQ